MMNENNKPTGGNALVEGRGGSPTVSAPIGEDVSRDCELRIDEFRRSALAMEDPRRAIINAAAADLMLIGSRVAESIKMYSGDDVVELEEWDEAMPAVAMLHASHRMVVQLDHIERRLAPPQESKGKGKRSRRNRKNKGRDSEK